MRFHFRTLQQCFSSGCTRNVVAWFVKLCGNRRVFYFCFKVVKCITETVLRYVKNETLFKKCIPNIILVFRYKNT